MKPLSYSTQWELKVTKGGEKKSSLRIYQKIFHIEWKFSWIFENNKIFGTTQVFETVCTYYAQINTSKPKIKVFSF